MHPCRPTLPKAERLCSRKRIDRLFAGGTATSMTAFPIRAVCMITDDNTGQADIEMLVSVSKRHLRHAVDRNRAKRQIREAYRLNKQTLYEALPQNRQIVIAFIWLSDKPIETKRVGQSIEKLIARVVERITGKPSKSP